MNMYYLYDVNKWSECVPIYKLPENQHFIWSFINEIGFAKDYLYPSLKRSTAKVFERNLCLPVEPKK
jgi:hypothetical protein